MTADSLIDDIRQAFRTLRRNLIFSATIITVLALGIGANAAGTGVFIGLVASVGASRLVATLLFGVPTTDVVTYSSAAAVMLSIAAAGAAYPAWRASRSDPSRTLRLH